MPASLTDEHRGEELARSQGTVFASTFRGDGGGPNIHRNHQRRSYGRFRSHYSRGFGGAFGARWKERGSIAGRRHLHVLGIAAGRLHREPVVSRFPVVPQAGDGRRAARCRFPFNWPSAEKQVITVKGEAGPTVSVEPDNNATALVIKGDDLEALPDDPDDLADALQALAGPGAGPNGGQIYIDGFSGGHLPPKESIREIRINQNPFSAEFDRLGFGRIEILTKPGTDKLRGARDVQRYGLGVSIRAIRSPATNRIFPTACSAATSAAPSTTSRPSSGFQPARY